MKILIPNYCLDDSFVDNVSFTLSKMGHEVIHMGGISVKKAYSKVFRTIKEIQNKVFPQISLQEKFILETIEHSKIDILLSLTQSLDQEVLYECKKKGIVTISWWGDTAANMKKRGLCTDGWDLVFIKDAFAAKKLKGVGINAQQLYEAMNPAWHKPTHKQANDKLIIAGSFYDYRQYLTMKLLNNNIKLGLYGPALPRWAPKEIADNHSKEYITKNKKAEIFGSGLGVLNSTAMSEFDSVNCRAFEIAGCGGLHIMEYRSAIEECFEPGKEVLTYNSLDQLLEIIDKAITHPEEMEKIRKAGAHRAHHEHTYENRLNHILSQL